MALKVTARNEASKHRISMPRFERSVKKILKTLGWKHAELNVLLTSDRDIRKINRKFLKHDYATDVIAFPGEGNYIGDIVVSLDTAASNCAAYGNTFSYETLFYVCHGILHLMGHDDSTSAKSKAMHRKQALVLKKAGLAKTALVS